VPAVLAAIPGRIRVGGAVPLTSKQRSELRSEAHHLSPTVHVGQHGITPSLVQSLDDALRARELVKIQLGRNTELDPREMANQLAADAKADVVQVIGKTATLYRENPELERKEGKASPWRR
jgi:RNA-binding protein